jgi:voltage-gated potassium channel Kch
MHDEPGQTPGGRVLILGDPAGLGEALARQLERLGAAPETVSGPTDAELTAMLSDSEWLAVAVLTHDDALALRLTLLCAHVRPELPLWVTLFDKTIADRLRQLVPAVNIFAPSELVAAALADQCCALIGRCASRLGHGLRIVDDALRLLVFSGGGLLIALVAQILLSVAALHEGLVDALYFSTRSVATVADAPNAASAAGWFKIASTLITLIALVLVAVFTAALVRRLSRPRLTTLVGRRRACASGHVLIVGFGQIGFRLAEELMARGVRVLALERNPDAPCVRLARKARVPVAVGRGDDRASLELAGVARCAAVAAVTSDDLANVAVGLAATDLRPEVPLVLRLGDGEVAAETESLLHLGRICDAHQLVARTLAGRVIVSDRRAPLPGPDHTVTTVAGRPRLPD